MNWNILSSGHSRLQSRIRLCSTPARVPSPALGLHRQRLLGSLAPSSRRIEPARGNESNSLVPSRSDRRSTRARTRTRTRTRRLLTTTTTTTNFRRNAPIRHPLHRQSPPSEHLLPVPNRPSIARLFPIKQLVFAPRADPFLSRVIQLLRQQWRPPAHSTTTTTTTIMLPTPPPLDQLRRKKPQRRWREIVLRLRPSRRRTTGGVRLLRQARRDVVA